MFRYEDLRLRRFCAEDIPLKVAWINDPQNNQYLHYDLPLEEEKTQRWFEANRSRTDRFDAVIEYLGKPVGLIGLLGIDMKNRKAEEYITVGDTSVKGQGIGTKAEVLMSAYAFLELKLHKVYVYAETGNEPSLRLYHKRGFSTEGTLHDDLCMNGRFVDRELLALTEEAFILPPEVYWEEP